MNIKIHTTMELTKQYKEIKECYPDCLLLFRCGDLYESYFEDAKACERILGVVRRSTTDGNETFDVAEFPFHKLDVYLPRLVATGKRIGICDSIKQDNN